MYTTNGEGTIMAILLMYLGIWFLFATAGLASYILRGIGMYTIGKRRGMQNPWLAFIPYARTYYQGELCGSITLKDKTIKSPGIWLLVIPIINGIISGLVFAVIYGSMFGVLIRYGLSENSVYQAEDAFNAMFSGSGAFLALVLLLLFILVSVAITAATSVLQVLVNQQIYSQYTSKTIAILHAVAGIMLPLYTSVYFFIIRNKQPVGERNNEFYIHNQMQR